MRLRFNALPLFIAPIVLLAATACSPLTSAAAVQAPTAASLASFYPLESADRIGREFLQNWRDGNVERMFALLSFGSQEATPRDTFVALYTDSERVMKTTELTVSAGDIYRESDAVAVLEYTVTFRTDYGDIADGQRTLRLVVDDRAEDWRVAWTPADLFPELAEGGRLRLESSPPNRANIYDRDGDVLADQEGRVAMVQITRQDAPDWPNCLNTLSAALNSPLDRVQTRLESRPSNELVEMGVIDEAAYNASYAALEQYCAARFDGQRVRRYPDGTVAPNLLGYVGLPDEATLPALEAAGFNAESIIGRAGIELTWDETLRGQPATRLVIVSPTGEVLRELGSRPATPGESLWLTFDGDFQRQVERIVADTYTQAKDSWGPGSPGASVVVIDVNTGAIRAMVSYPTFDNNAYNSFPIMGRATAAELIASYQSDARRPELNRPAQGIYTLGSVMKTITAAAAADSGVYALDEPYVCTGMWNRDIPRIDWLAGGHGALTLPGALTQSCNPYFYEAGYNLFMADPAILPDYALRLGFGAPTGIADILEDGGFIPTPDWYRRAGGAMTFSDGVNLAIGQGEVQVTPLQVTRWIAAIANGGTLYRPYLVEQVGLVGETPETVAEIVPTATGLRPEVIDMLRTGMCAVTTAAQGTATFVFRNSPLQSIGVCGKTGTAQTGGPSTPSHAWFASYAPRETPEIAVVVMVETAGQGSEIAAPIARQVYEAYFGMTP